MNSKKIIEHLFEQWERSRVPVYSWGYLTKLKKEEMTPTNLALRIINDGFGALIFDDLEWMIREGKVGIVRLTSELVKGEYSQIVVSKLKRFISLGVDPWRIIDWFLKERKGDKIVRFFSQFLANGIEPEALVRRLIKAGNGVEVLALMNSSSEDGKPYQTSDLVAYGVPAETLAKWLIENDDKEIVEDNFNLFTANGADVGRLEAMLK